MHSEADEARLIGLRGYRLIARDFDAFDAVAPDWHRPGPVEAMEADKDAANPPAGIHPATWAFIAVMVAFCASIALRVML